MIMLKLSLKQNFKPNFNAMPKAKHCSDKLFFFFWYQSKEITKKVYNNIMKSIQIPIWVLYL